MAKPFAFKELPAEAFPFTISLLDYDTGEKVWSQTVTGASAVEIPDMRPRVCWCCVKLATGTVITQPPLALCPECGTVVESIEHIRAGYCPTCEAETYR